MQRTSRPWSQGAHANSLRRRVLVRRFVRPRNNQIPCSRGIPVGEVCCGWCRRNPAPGSGMASRLACRRRNLQNVRIQRLCSKGQSSYRSQGAGMAGRGQGRQGWLMSCAYCSSSGEFDVGPARGELPLESPIRAHRITAPLRSDVESLKELWVTEKSKMSLPSDYSDRALLQKGHELPERSSEGHGN